MLQDESPPARRPLADPPMFAGLSAADRAQLARCAWQRQQGAGQPARGDREFSTVALWTAAAAGGAAEPTRRR